jgi:hypothetical protein
MPRRTILVPKDAVWVTECARDISAVRGYYACRVNLENVPRLFRRHYWILEYIGGASGPSGCCSSSPLSSMIVLALEEVPLLQGDGELPWTRHPFG